MELNLSVKVVQSLVPETVEEVVVAVSEDTGSSIVKLQELAIIMKMISDKILDN
jgi:hypothetical protein